MPPAIPDRLVLFCRLLRAAGLNVTPGRALDAARCLSLVDIADAGGFRAALRASLTISVDDFPVFDDAFDRFWLDAGKQGPAPVATPNMTTIQNRPEGPPVYSLVRMPSATVSADGEARLPGGDHTAGDADILTAKDFRDYDTADSGRARRLIQQLAPKLATVPSRRFTGATSGAVDIRRSIQQARRQGGEVLSLSHRKPKRNRLRLVALCDVSGSMDIYSNHLLQFCWALQQHSGNGVRTFAFSTRLREITPVLRRRRFEDVLVGLSRTVETWSGGTTIGACLAEFNTKFAKHAVGPRTVVIVASDGWERGDAGELGQQMRLLALRAHRIIWLNPLKAREGYAPLAAGMAAALPYVDDFLPAESIRSLERLKQVLARA